MVCSLGLDWKGELVDILMYLIGKFYPGFLIMLLDNLLRVCPGVGQGLGLADAMVCASTNASAIGGDGIVTIGVTSADATIGGMSGNERGHSGGKGGLRFGLPPLSSVFSAAVSSPSTRPSW